MASTTKEKKKSREYYAKNKKYREEKISKETSKHKSNRSLYAKKQKDYYKKSAKYRKYKIAYAKAYKRSHKKK